MPERVLLIDDDFAITRALMIRLKANHFEVDCAPDGTHGMAAIERFRPDVILLDIRMPDMTGFEVCRWLKAQEHLRHTPVIFLSANITDDTRHEAIEAGGTAFLAKPYEASRVIEMIRTQLANPANPAAA